MPVGIQLVAISHGGVVVPIALSRNPELVQDVARKMIAEFRQRTFSDEVLNQIATAEAKRLAEFLHHEGLETDRSPRLGATSAEKSWEDSIERASDRQES